jgi:uncharacterized protein
MKNVLITGGSGMIGKRLTELLLQRGYTVSHLGRANHNGAVKNFLWDIERRHIDPETFEGVDVIVHLAGAGIADKRWTEKRKKQILNSRVDSTRLLHDELKKRKHRVKTFIAASAVGYYGFENDEKYYTEDDEPGDDFLARVTKRWEDEVDALTELGLRVVKLRTGIVLTRSGGVLKEFIRPIKLYVGAPLGSGGQYLSWVHIDDHCGILIKALEENIMTGAYNSVAPTPVTNAALNKAIATIIGKPILLPPIPGFLLKLVLGEMANLVIYGSRVSADKVIRAGYTFKFADLGNALRDLLDPG